MQPDQSAETGAAGLSSLSELNEGIAGCRACPRLVAWREQVAIEKRRSFAHQTYWGRAVPSFGSDRPGILILGLAPAAHGANRTGRMFTGDRSGDWLYAALHRCGLASQPNSVSRDDGMRLDAVRITAAVHCAPPDNKPTTEERDTCRSWLVRELDLVWPSVRAIVVLGGFGWAALWPALRSAGHVLPRIPSFGHGVEVALPDARTVIGCYHVSQQNTFTGRLTEPMLDAVLTRAAAIADLR